MLTSCLIHVMIPSSGMHASNDSERKNSPYRFAHSSYSVRTSFCFGIHKIVNGLHHLFSIHKKNQRFFIHFKWHIFINTLVHNLKDYLLLVELIFLLMIFIPHLLPILQYTYERCLFLFIVEFSELFGIIKIAKKKKT